MTTTPKKARRTELLSPAGSLEKLKIAVLYGADAIYIGTPDLSLRTKSAFTLEELVEGINFAHEHGKRVYLTLNLFSHNKDIEKLPTFIDTIRTCKPDGVIIADPGVFHYVREHAPELELHVSTQANVCSWLSVKFWEEQGAGLCVLGRETSFAEIAEIREKCPDIKLESFVHGSMCMAYSGRCLLSNFMSERGANQGNCANSCRWDYKVHIRMKDGSVKELPLNKDNIDLFDFYLEEGCRPGEYMEIEENERGSYIMNAKELCLMPKLNEYLGINIDSLKIEGRNKSQYYLAIVTRAYRMAIDDWYKDPESWSPKPYMEELAKIPTRGYTLAFHDGRLSNLAHNYDDTHTISEWEFAGFIVDIEEDAFIVEVKNTIEAGDVLEFVSPTTRETILLRIYEFIHTKNDEVTTIVHAGPKPRIRIPFEWFHLEERSSLAQHFPLYSILRKEKPLSQEERDRIALDKEASQLELGKGSEKAYEEKRTTLQESIAEGLKDKTLKTPRVGIEGCCGKGCNGCLIFWHDPAYEKARALLKKKKMGEMLDSNMREDVA